MNSIIEDIQKKFGYYRLSLYIYSFSTFMEILLLGNYKNDYLLNKKEELNELKILSIDSTTFRTSIFLSLKNRTKKFD